MRAHYPGKFTYVWGFKNPERWKSLQNEDTVVCKYRSVEYYRYRMTSKFYISNAIEGTEVPKREGQIRIQTWHGGGSYKTVANQENSASKALRKREEENAAATDLFLTSCDAFTRDTMRSGFAYKGPVLADGSPRNDSLVNGSGGDIRKRVRKELGLDEDEFMILFAPTWRYDTSLDLDALDNEAVLNAVGERFGRKTKLFYRSHIHMTKGAHNRASDVSKYPDMQELLQATDMLITDYSSSVWDFSFTYKPCLLFAPDVDSYAAERGFYYPPDQWGFPLCRTNEELCEAVRTFDEASFKAAMDEHHANLGSCETGHAARSVAEYIVERARS